MRLTVNPSVPYAVILTLTLAILGSYGAGAWFLATQTATNLAVAERLTTTATTTNERVTRTNERLTRMEAAITTRFEAWEKRDEARAAAVASIDNRLSRMEAQLAFLVTQGQGVRR